MNIPFFDLKQQIRRLATEIDEAVRAVYERGVFISGVEVSRFERGFADYLGAKYCVTCANGTDALELLLEVYNIGEGDEVIVPAYGWVSPYNAVKRAGAIPVLVDVGADGNIDPERVRELIGEKTRVVIPIHLYGNPCRIAELKDLCSERGILLFEDCAQAHGAEVGGKKVGTFGDVAIFSFYPTKNLGCYGDGGAIVTDNQEINTKVKELRDYGRISRQAFRIIGRNSRMDEIQAAILSVKLKYLDSWNGKRKEIARAYWESLKLDLEQFPENSVFYQFTLRVRDRDGFITRLKDKGICADIHYPFTIAGAYGLEGAFFNATLLSNQLVSLPIYPELTESEISYICDQLTLLEDFMPIV